jgi:excinuclease ABC subunit C
MTKNELGKKIPSFPTTPGVYLMKDAKGRVLYVGKANNLRDRVSSYFVPSADLTVKTRALVSNIEEIECLDCGSEVDALLTEARLIKDLQPKYNVCLKDGKTFPLVAIDESEDFPRVFVVRESDIERKAQRKDESVGANRRSTRPGATDAGEPRLSLHGPFLHAGELRAALKMLQAVFRFRMCGLDIREDDDKRRFFRPCLLYSIKLCSGPCGDRVGRARYREGIRFLREFLRGRRGQLLKRIRAQMAKASEALDFEKAGFYRDQLKALSSLAMKGELGSYPSGDIGPADPGAAVEELRRFLGLQSAPRKIEGMDISNISGQDSVGALVSFLDGLPFKDGYRRYRIKGVAGVDDYAMMAEVVRRRFARLIAEETTFPDILLIDGGAGHLMAARRELRKLGVKDPPTLIGLAKTDGDHLTWCKPGDDVPIPRDSIAFRLLQHVRDEAHRFAQHYHHALRRKRTLGET